MKAREISVLRAIIFVFQAILSQSPSTTPAWNLAVVLAGVLHSHRHVVEVSSREYC